MSELESHIDRFLAELKRNNVSPHTLAAYGSDLAQFLEYFSPPGSAAPALREFDVWKIREWLGKLYSQKLSPVSTRRKLAAVRALFRFLAREGTIEINPARLVRSPKAPVRLPSVMTAEQVNGLLEDVIAQKKLARRHPARDVAIFEFLYGCGLRVSELVGLNLEDIDRGERWLRVRGKGREGGKCRTGGGQKPRSIATCWIAAQRRACQLLFINFQGGRLGVGGGREASQTLRRGISPAIPRRIRTAFATPMPRTCSPTAPTCARSRNCSATRGSPPHRSIRRSL